MGVQVALLCARRKRKPKWTTLQHLKANIAVVPYLNLASLNWSKICLNLFFLTCSSNRIDKIVLIYTSFASISHARCFLECYITVKVKRNLWYRWSKMELWQLWQHQILNLLVDLPVVCWFLLSLPQKGSIFAWAKYYDKVVNFSSEWLASGYVFRNKIYYFDSKDLPV